MNMIRANSQQLSGVSSHPFTSSSSSSYVLSPSDSRLAQHVLFVRDRQTVGGEREKERKKERERDRKETHFFARSPLLLLYKC